MTSVVPSEGGSTGTESTSTFVTATNESANLPNSRVFVNGTNTTVDISTPGQIAINATGGGTDLGSLIWFNDDTTVGANEFVFAFNGVTAKTLTLPLAPTPGTSIWVYNYGTANLTVDTGDANIYISGGYNSIVMPQDGFVSCFTYLTGSNGGDVYYDNWAMTGHYIYDSIVNGRVQIYDSDTLKGVSLSSQTSATRSVYLRNAGATTQIGLVSTTSADSNTIPKWVKGIDDASGNIGGYFQFNSNLGAGDKVAGVATTSGGTVTVSTTAITANSLVFLTPQHSAATTCTEDKASRVNGTSFVIKTGADCDVAWWLVEP